jgi:uncharacterized C2H2 Zn-finger protein
MAIQVGKANYKSQESTRLTFHKLGHKEPKQRTLVVRLAPPIGPLADRGIWALYLKQHWGYSVPFVGNDGKSRNIPLNFKCIEKTDRDGTITTHCPECDLIKVQKDKLKSKKESLEKEGKSKEEVQAATQYVASWTRDHNCDRKWHIVAKDTNGVWGFFQCSHAAYKLLKGNERVPGLIDKLLGKGVDPLSPEKGVWIKWERSGESFNDIKDIPTVYTEDAVLDGETVQRTKYDSLTQSDLDALEKLPSLDALGRDLTLDQIKMLVESGGDEEVVRTVFKMPKIVAKQETPASSAKVDEILDEEPEEEVASLPAPKPAPAPVAAAPVEAVVDEEEAEMARLQAAMAAAAARKAAKASAPKAEPAKVEPEPAPTSKALAELEGDMDAFMAKYK